MDRLDALRVFVAVAERLSFTLAARDLRISATAASRAIADLEAGLGVALLRRTTRSVGLTAEGAGYLQRCRAVLADLDEADRSLRGEDAEPRGGLIITAPVLFGRMHVSPVVSDLIRAHPALDVELTLTDRIVRLVEEGVDVAVRIADLADSALHAVRVSETRRVLAASPAYLAERGTPQTLSDLRHHQQIVFDAFAPNGEWRFGPGRSVVRCEPRLLTNSADVAVAAALEGLGIARVLCYQVAAHVAAGRLVQVLPSLDPEPAPVSLVFQARRRRSPNVRAFIEAMQARFRTDVPGVQVRDAIAPA
jgi:DNA-binding transcriptional LysR family regulator